MKPISRLGILFLLIASLNSCSCEPESIAKGAIWGLEKMMGEGFMPSDEIRALGNFQGMNVNLSQKKDQNGSESTIFLKLENGDPLLLGDQPDLLARKCAELYIRDFENSDDYELITVQFIQTDPMNPDNFAMKEYTFNTVDF
ncbi:hypothetical protein [Algoriphagus sediminis]|uniref:Uncharacterized protein n=1 Tax=Algoriphagus sediminis TaxID=3057113 RepID=A0ABT7YFT3_9BACT|nr:hypothetical protein [Algoriphagus sediminis]MDN3205064.1 hypothetical protein [Algoriphagus sediminis]